MIKEQNLGIRKKEYRTLIYCRLSKDDGSNVVSKSIEGQIAFCKDFVKNQPDLKLVKEPLCDDGFTGLNFSRPSFQELDKLVRKGAIDCIVCRDLSRFTRDYIGGGDYIERILPKYGIRFIAINNCDTLRDDPQTIAFMIPFLNLINDSYSRDTSIKIRSSLIIKRKKGDYVGAFCPYGYMRSPTNRHKLVPDEKAVATVQQIFTYFKDGFSVGQIAKKLNQLSVPTPLEYKQSQGIQAQAVFQTNDVAKWEYNTVKRILTNDVYIGVLSQGKSTTKNYKSKVKEIIHEEDWVRVENAHEPVVSLDDFHAVQELMTRNTRVVPDKGDGNLLSGFIFCGDCGGTMVKKSLKSGGKTYAYYVCSNHKKKKICSSHNISRSLVEENVLNTIHDQVELVLNLQEVMDTLELTECVERANFSYEQQISDLVDEIKKYKQIKLGLYTDLKDGILTMGEYEDFKSKYDIFISEKEKAKEKLEKTCNQAENMSISTNNWVQLFKDNQNVEEIDKRVLMALVDKVLIYENHTIEVIFKYGEERHKVEEYITFATHDLKLMTM